MSGLEAWLVLANSLNPLAPGEGLGKTGGLVLRDLLLILGSGLILLLLLLFWASNYVRRSKRVRHSRPHHRPPSQTTTTTTTARPADETASANPTGSSQPGITAVNHPHRRRRRRRRDHRSRNPSLAEVGGLPPQRSGPAAPSDS